MSPRPFLFAVGLVVSAFLLQSWIGIGSTVPADGKRFVMEPLKPLAASPLVALPRTELASPPNEQQAIAIGQVVEVASAQAPSDFHPPADPRLKAQGENTPNVGDSRSISELQTSRAELVQAVFASQGPLHAPLAAANDISDRIGLSGTHVHAIGQRAKKPEGIPLNKSDL